MTITSHDGQPLHYEAGDAFHLKPGHMPLFHEDTEFLEYTPRQQLEALLHNMGLALPP